MRVDLSNFQFTPNILEVEAGKTARFNLATDGLPHTFTIADLGIDIVIPHGTTAKTVEFFVPLETSGELQLVCRIHIVLDMVATIRVK